MSDLRFIGEPEQQAALFTALASAQAEFPSLEKSKTADVQKEGRRLYVFNYADLGAIQRAIQPILAKHGIAVFHAANGVDDVICVTAIMAGHGARVENDYYIGRGNLDIQKQGSAITYAKRYTYKAITGFEPDGEASEDDDGNAAVGNHANITNRQPPKVPDKEPRKPPERRPESRQPDKEPAPNPRAAHANAALAEIRAMAEKEGLPAPGLAEAAEPPPERKRPPLADDDAPDHYPLPKGTPTRQAMVDAISALGVSLADQEAVMALMQTASPGFKPKPTPTRPRATRVSASILTASIWGASRG